MHKTKKFFDTYNFFLSLIYSSYQKYNNQSSIFVFPDNLVIDLQDIPLTMQNFISILIIIHAGLGGIALLSGLIAVLSKKGKKTHTKSGLLFYYTMLTSAFTALIISVLPMHENPFLFSIGIFSSYFILMGKQALTFKKGIKLLLLEKSMTIIFLLTGFFMITYSFTIYQTINVVLLIFGILAVLFGIRDLRLLYNPQSLKQKWLGLHIGNMMGGYIAAVTAFVVVNEIFPGVYGWFLPGILGGLYSYYWIRRVKSDKKPNYLP